MTSVALSTPRRSKAARATVLLGGALLSGAIAQAVFTFAVVRWFTTETTGTFFIGLAVLTLVGYIGRFGTEQLALREASPAWANGEYQSFREIAAWMRQTVLRGTALSGLLTLALLAAIALIARPEALTNSPEIWLAVLAMAPISMVTTGCALLRAGDRLVASISARYLAIFILALALLALGVNIDVIPASPMLSLGLSAAVVSYFVWRDVTSLTEAKPTPTTEYVAPDRRSAAAQLTTSTLLTAALTWTDRLILGALAGTAAVGVYGVAWQLVLPFNLVYLLSGTVSSPTFARLYAAGELAKLETTTRALSLAHAVAATGLGALIIVATPTVLNFVGDEYGDVQLLTIILIVGQVINLSAGQVGMLYAMAGQDSALLRITGYSTLISLIAIFGLTIPFGATGTAVGVTVGLVTKNLALAVVARTHLDIAPTFLLPKRQERASGPVRAIVEMLA